MILLIVDIGNSFAKVGVFNGNFLEYKTKKTAQSLLALYQWVDYWKHITSEARIDGRMIDLLAYSCVNNSVLPPFLEWVHSKFPGIPVTPIDASIYPYRIEYLDPQSLGSDRIADAFAGYRRMGGPVIVVDFGTAVTINVVGSSGEFLGGAIAPGSFLMAKALAGGTSKLPHVNSEFPQSVFGKSTSEGLAVGVTFGLVDLIDGLIQRMEDTLGRSIRAVSTGGAAVLIGSRCRKIKKNFPDLTLEGIAALATYNHKDQ